MKMRESEGGKGTKGSKGTNQPPRSLRSLRCGGGAYVKNRFEGQGKPGDQIRLLEYVPCLSGANFRFEPTLHITVGNARVGVDEPHGLRASLKILGHRQQQVISPVVL